VDNLFQLAFRHLRQEVTDQVLLSALAKDHAVDSHTPAEL
jgi:hypothetical protein